MSSTVSPTLLSSTACVTSLGTAAVLDPRGCPVGRPPGPDERSAAQAGAPIPLGQCITAAPQARATEVCRHCGGSGMLRVSDLSYRTCMDCLGLGKLVISSGEVAWVRKPLSGSVCASGAR
jgi:hypothetical protein